MRTPEYTRLEILSESTRTGQDANLLRCVRVQTFLRVVFSELASPQTQHRFFSVRGTNFPDGSFFFGQGSSKLYSRMREGERERRERGSLVSNACH